MVNRTSSNSGAIDFNIMIIIANHPGVILKDPIQAVTVCCVGVVGATLRTACVLLTATTSILIIGTPTAATVFAVCQDSLLRSSRPLSVHSMIFAVFPMVIYSVFKLKLKYKGIMIRLPSTQIAIGRY